MAGFEQVVNNLFPIVELVIFITVTIVTIQDIVEHTVFVSNPHEVLFKRVCHCKDGLNPIRQHLSLIDEVIEIPDYLVRSWHFAWDSLSTSYSRREESIIER